MRLLTTTTNETHASRFGKYLLAQGMENTVEPANQGWAVWVHHDDHLERAGEAWRAFEQNPDAPQYKAAESTARAITAQQTAQATKARDRYIDYRTQTARMRLRAVPV